MDPAALLEIETHLKAMQAHKFPATRGPEGYYSKIKALSLAAETDRKQRRKQEIEEIKARGLSVESDLPLLPPVPPRTPKRMSSSQSFTTSQHEDDVEYITQKSSTVTRKPRTFSNPSKDDMFEMELEEQTSPLLLSTPVKPKNKAWRKFSLTSPELRPQASEHPSPGTSPGWSLSASQDK
jgi:hypothetical protein